MGLGVLLTTAGVVSAAGVIEALGHRRNLMKIPLRIHVNGTRGKSSVTRLIASGLRASGRRTCAKTTGTLARMILPDGREYPVFRPSRPNVIEQVRIIRTAAELEAEALVIECMAVQPGLQALCEERFVRATHGVITNARPDHLDVMGPTDEDVALAIAGTTPYKGTLFTAEQKHLPIFEMAAKDRRSEVVPVGEDAVSAVSDEDMDGFSYIEHRENVALALTVCQSLGAEREVALKGMWDGTPDPGMLTSHELSFFGKRIIFVNGFAANDPQSTASIWSLVQAKFPTVQRKVSLVNCRSDRPDRSRQLGEACVDWGFDHHVLIGSGTYIFAKAAMDKGLPPFQLTFAEGRRIEEIFELIVELSSPSALVMGMANIGGQGLELVRYFKNRSIKSVTKFQDTPEMEP